MKETSATTRSTGNASDVVEPQDRGDWFVPAAGPVDRRRNTSCQLISCRRRRDHLAAAAVQQHLGEATGRRPGVEGSSSHAELEIIKRAEQLVGSPRDVLIGGASMAAVAATCSASPLDNRAVDAT